MSSNILIRTNVICQEVSDEGGAVIASTSDAEIVERIDYWELFGLMESNPLRFSSQLLQDRNLTEKQRRQRDAFIREGTRQIWPDFSKFQPMRSAADIVGDQVSESEALAQTPSDTSVQESDQDDLPIDIASAQAERIANEGLSARLDQRASSPTSRRRGVNEDESVRREIVEAEPSARLVVIAPPGTGKTHTLVDRLCSLVEHSNPDSPREAITVLSFSRAAVAEIIRRVLERLKQGAQDDLRYVSIRTFDSFATEMLLKDLDREVVGANDYEERIRLFTSRIRHRGASNAGDSLDRIQCLLIDEIQDLVGVRADLVLELVKRVLATGGGVLLLGDPAQAIYDWQVKPGGTTSCEFLEKLRNILGPTAKYCELSRYFRYADERVLEFVAKARSAMGANGLSPDSMRLSSLFRDLGKPVSLSDLESMVLEGRKIAVLTRNNLEAYQIATWCEQQGISVATAGASREYWPGWIARLTLGFAQDSMSRDMALKRWESMVAARSTVSFPEAIDFLDAQGVINNDSIDLRALCSRIEQRAPFSNHFKTKASIILTTVSTIHRSKGLEFDTVLVLEPDNSWQGDPRGIRVFYVAATRARQDVRFLDRDKAVLKSGKKSLGSMSLEHFLLFKQKNNFLLLDGLECLDVSSVLNATAVDATRELASAVRKAQEALWQTHAGRLGEVSIRRTIAGDYRFIVEEVSATPADNYEVCSASRGLQRDLKNFSRYFAKARGAVLGLKNVRIVDVATVAMRGDGSTARDQLGAAQLAMVPVPYGEALVETERSL